MNAPVWLDAAKAHEHVKIEPGGDLSWLHKFQELAHVERTDEYEPWCSVFACATMENAGIRSVRSAWARDWLRWGRSLAYPVYGCIVVFSRGNAGHVGFFIKEVDADHILVFGGNQGHEVKYATFPKAKVLGYRWPAAEAPSEPMPRIVTAGMTQFRQPPQPQRLAEEDAAPVEDWDETEQRLRDNGSRTVEHADASEAKGQAVAGAGVIGAVLVSLHEFIEPIMPILMKVGPIALLGIAGLGIAIWYEQKHIKRARVDDDRSGKNLSRR